MAWRPHPRGAEVNPSNLRAWATCDDCGFVYNIDKLDWQFQWAGMSLINQRLLKCPRCLDIPQEQLRVIVLPPDPDPIINARPEQYSIDEGLISTFTASIAPDPKNSGQGIMTVSFVTTGVVSTGAAITSGAAAGSVIGKQLTGANPPGGTGTYVVTPSQTAVSTTMTTD